MNIQNLSLTNFRNFASKKIIFDPKLTVIIGPNGSGKSNILEAAGLLAAVRIHRVDTDLDFVKFGQADSKVESRVEPPEASLVKDGSREDSKTLTINFQVVDETYVKKAYFVDSIKKRLVDFTEHFSVIFFEPSDLELVSGPPSDRRHHLDTLLASVDRDYWRAITNYNKVVVRRNKVLQRILDGESKKSELDFWDERLLEHGKFLTAARQEFFEFINFVNSAVRGPVSSFPPASARSDLNSSGRDVDRADLRADGSLSRTATPRAKANDFSWGLRQSLLSEEKLLKNRDRDIAAGVTLSGPHRDDFVFLFREKNLEFFGSRGEQRMAVLALKLAELEYYNSKRGARPILALDDIFSELDWEHREAVLSVIEKQQTIITAAEEESLPKQVFKKAKVVELR